MTPLGVIEVIYSDVTTDPSSDVPGVANAKFQGFDRPFGHPNGNWVITADTDLPTTEDEVLIVNGVVEVREGTAAAWASGEDVGALDTKVGVNGVGEFVFATNSSGPTTADDYIVIGVPTVSQTAAAQEGGTALLSGTTWGADLEAAVVFDDGSVGFTAENLGGGTLGQDDIVVLGANILLQTGVTMPTGQLGTETWQTFDFDDYWATPDGTHWLFQGDLSGATTTDDVVAFDGMVIVQEGVVLAGTAFSDPVDLNGIVGISLAADGTYFVRGNNGTTELDWVYSNGAVLAMVGMPITTGNTELWDDASFADCFFLHVGNDLGDHVIGGVTDAVDATANAVMVLNGTTVVLRENDPVDLDANGQFDDNLFIHTFGNDDAFLTDDGWLYFVASLRNMNGTTAVADVFLRVKVF